MCKVNPRVDFAFKLLFGKEENKDILIDFLNAILAEEPKIKDLQLKNPYNYKTYKFDKGSIMDIKAKDEYGRWINIEMQIADQEYYDKRALYYWARMYVGQLSEGVNYDFLTKTININILNFNAIEDETDYHNKFKILNIESNNELLDHLEIHFIELGKFTKELSQLSTAMDRWIAFLKNADKYDREYIPDELAEVETINKANTLLDTISLTSDEREFYEAKLKWLRDEEAAIKTALNKGLRQGREEGRKEGRKEGEDGKAFEIAKNLLDVLDDETIALKTGLSKDDIKKLR
ncbi:Rpn family recombination-promoting nuclease/putative transposase [Herbivorax sp. ANBcel31]|uniref:Rpn family recombination-promoting nuclease/putative transposase n=1 Tax=Herbivorax sp. ANBcel31 TaxID=3069754 RepID=UPI0027AE017C|nr:Rpn family recombination-promoting nuclease/putative transposase [Herbivorax sp. ANBcel31]MDQ2085600.1 Rpn family recombination-promoting nuclease/putative transposase [Herbivorax sp. ANBcel31]